MAGNIMQGDFFDTLDHVEQHLHSNGICLPAAADPVLLSTIASAWPTAASVLITEVSASAASPQTGPFDLHWAVVSDISANGYYELLVFKGSAGAEEQIACVPFIRDAVFAQEGALPLITPRIAKGTRISAALRGSNAAVNTCRVKFSGHAYTH